MNILAIGDLVGDPGVKKLENSINRLKEEEKIDFTVVNAENAADGSGITINILERLKNIGINAITMGNHTWGKKEIFKIIDDPILIRPANYSKGVVGHGYYTFKCNLLNGGIKNICVINLIGRVAINVNSENPFTRFDEIYEEVKNKVDIIIVDFHAEATAEKIAMCKYIDGKATMLFGTHTHVVTADEMITEKKMAYITDIGMTGPINSVLGMDPDVAIKRFVTSIPESYKVATGPSMLNGIIVNIDEKTNKAIAIKRICLR